MSRPLTLTFGDVGHPSLRSPLYVLPRVPSPCFPPKSLWPSVFRSVLSLLLNLNGRDVSSFLPLSPVPTELSLFRAQDRALVAVI